MVISLDEWDKNFANCLCIAPQNRFEAVLEHC
jgi:hypothetical protein